MKKILKRLITEFWDKKPEYVPREKIPKGLEVGKNSIVIIGPRRAGKSYTIHEIRDSLIKKGLDKRDFIYINFEDERLAEFNAEDFDLILETYYEMHEKKPVVFLDEIQKVDKWERYIRRLADTDYKVVATGSNSEMLSREIADKLGGRFPEIEIYPLDFVEFLKFKGMKLEKESLYSKDRFAIKKYFDEYFQYGAFPEIALLSDKASKMKVLRSYFNLVFYRDMIARKKLQNETALRFIIKKLRETIGNDITPRAIYSSLKKADIEVGPNTVENYVDYLDEAFLVVPCTLFAKSVVKQEKTKRYFIDNGYIKIFEVKEDKDLLLENLVFTELLKKEKEAHFHQGKKECDFVIEGKEAIQVAYELNDGNMKRETEGLVEAMDAYRIKKGIIVTYDQEKEIEVDKKKIQVIPAWKWCLGV
jgi:predicted AAA+ superfamily ATPase